MGEFIMARKKIETSTNVGDVPKTHKPNGQFAKGNKLGKGNPFGRETAQLRAYLFGNISQGDWDAVHKALVDKAKEGDVKALNLLFSYTLGKPVQQMDVNVTQSNISPEEAKQRISRFFGLGNSDDKKV